jgi:predicted nuclease of predicted toxin-antitoxin system
MSLSILVDMNLSVEWLPTLSQAGWPAVHWSQIGDPRADDATIMAWARTNAHVVFTHDLDFTTLLALTQATGPSVIQVRSQNVLPDYLGTVVIVAIRRFETELEKGALVVVDVARARMRILPL